MRKRWKRKTEEATLGIKLQLFTGCNNEILHGEVDSLWCFSRGTWRQAECTSLADPVGHMLELILPHIVP